MEPSCPFDGGMASGDGSGPALTILAVGA